MHERAAHRTHRAYTRAGRMLIAGAFVLMALMGACVLIFNRV